MSHLGVIEKKVYGALLMLSNGENVVTASNQQIARKMGYKRSGGAISFALKSLEHHNHIEKRPDGSIKVFV